MVSIHKPWIAFELKLQDWKRALWQSIINKEIADICFVALHERFISRAMNQKGLFEYYGIGLISVAQSSAAVVLPGVTVHNLTRRRQQVLTAIELGIGKRTDYSFETVPVLFP
jgi:hypothetical protein